MRTDRAVRESGPVRLVQPMQVDAAAQSAPTQLLLFSWMLDVIEGGVCRYFQALRNFRVIFRWELFIQSRKDLLSVLFYR